MNKYTVQKLFEQFQPGDEVTFNLRQAKYLLLSGHIVPAEVEQPAIIETPAVASLPETETIVAVDDQEKTDE